MKRNHWWTIAFVALTFLGVEQAQANRVSEVVAARANARAGGPLSENEIWLLERYGALSGTHEYWKDNKRGHEKRRRRFRRFRWDYHY